MSKSLAKTIEVIIINSNNDYNDGLLGEYLKGGFEEVEPAKLRELFRLLGERHLALALPL